MSISTQCTGFNVNNEPIIVVYTENTFWGFIPIPQNIQVCSIMIDLYGIVMYFDASYGIHIPIFYCNRYMHSCDVVNPINRSLFCMPGIFSEELETNDPERTRRFDDGQRVEIVEGVMPYASITYAVIDSSRFTPALGAHTQGLVAGTIQPVIAVNTTTFNVVGTSVPITQVYLADAHVNQNHFYPRDHLQDSQHAQMLHTAAQRARPDLVGESAAETFVAMSINNSETLRNIIEMYFPELTSSLRTSVGLNGEFTRFSAPLRQRDGRDNLRILGNAMSNL